MERGAGRGAIFPLDFRGGVRTVAFLFFDWLHVPLGIHRSKTAESLSGVFWILPLVGVRRCLSRVVGLS